MPAATLRWRRLRYLNRRVCAPAKGVSLRDPPREGEPRLRDSEARLVRVQNAFHTGAQVQVGPIDLGDRVQSPVSTFRSRWKAHHRAFRVLLMRFPQRLNLPNPLASGRARMPGRAARSRAKGTQFRERCDHSPGRLRVIPRKPVRLARTRRSLGTRRPVPCGDPLVAARRRFSPRVARLLGLVLTCESKAFNCKMSVWQDRQR